MRFTGISGVPHFSKFVSSIYHISFFNSYTPLFQMCDDTVFTIFMFYGDMIPKWLFFVCINRWGVVFNSIFQYRHLSFQRSQNRFTIGKIAFIFRCTALMGSAILHYKKVVCVSLAN